jgi:hypothetical protein
MTPDALYAVRSAALSVPVPAANVVTAAVPQTSSGPAPAPLSSL